MNEAKAKKEKGLPWGKALSCISSKQQVMYL